MARITAPGFFRIDQWMVQHLCQVLRKARVIVVSDGAPVEAATGGMVQAASSVEAALASALANAGAQPHVAVIPQGPYVLATVRGRKLSLGRAWLDEAA